MLFNIESIYFSFYQENNQKLMKLFLLSYLGSGGSSVVQHRTHDQKVMGLSPGKSGRRIFFFRVNLLS